MRILVLNYEFPPVGGGGGQVSADLAREFASAGHAVRVLTSACDTLSRFERRDGYDIVRVPVLRRHRDRCSIPEMVSYIALSLWPLAQETRRLKPDLIHAHFGIPTGPLALAARLVHRVPYVLTIHAGDVPGFMPDEVGFYHRLIRPLTRLIWRKAARVVAVSRGIRDMARQTASDLPVDVIHNGIAPDLVATPPPDRAFTPPLKLLFVGRVVEQKGLACLMHALRQVPAEGWQLTVIGDGPKRAEIEALAATYGLERQVRFLGWLAREDVLAAYRQNDVFVLPSVTEGMPVVMLEAMAFAMPLIGTDVPGTQDLIDDGHNGWLVPPQQPEALAEAIRSALSAGPDRLRAMGQASHHRARDSLTWPRLAAEYLTLFERILA